MKPPWAFTGMPPFDRFCAWVDAQARAATRPWATEVLARRVAAAPPGTPEHAKAIDDYEWHLGYTGTLSP